jgi:hypothetical protein
MKRACLLIVVPALLVALGFAQTPTASSNTDPTSIKGCLGGSEGNYTFVEDNTGHNFKITTSTVDLKPHLGHDVTLVGQKASASATTGAADNGVAVTSLNMISEHCAAAAGAPAASISAPADDAIPPTADAAVPAATIPAPADNASAPAAAPAALPATVAPPAETPITPTAAAPAPVALASTPAKTASAPAAVARRTEPPAQHPRPSATPAATTPAQASSTPVADAATLPETGSTPSASDTEPAPAVATPAGTAKSASSWLWIPIVAVVLILGALAPLGNRWRKRRLLERSDAQNLSFSHRASSELGNSDKPTRRKAA